MSQIGKETLRMVLRGKFVLSGITCSRTALDFDKTVTNVPVEREFTLTNNSMIAIPFKITCSHEVHNSCF